MSKLKSDTVINVITVLFLICSHWSLLKLTYTLIRNYSFAKLWSVKSEYFVQLFQWTYEISFLFAFYMYYFVYKRFTDEPDYINCLPSTPMATEVPKVRKSSRNQLFFAGFVFLASQYPYGLQLISSEQRFSIIAYLLSFGSGLLHALFMIEYNIECLAFLSLIGGINSFIKDLKEKQAPPSIDNLVSIKLYYDHFVEGVESLDKKFCFIISGYLLNLTLAVAISAEFTVDVVRKNKGSLFLSLGLLLSVIYVLTFLVKCASDVSSECRKTGEYFKEYLNSIAAKEQISEDFRNKYRELKDCGFLKQKVSLTIFGFYKIRDSLVLNLIFNIPSLYTLFTCLKPKGKP